MITGILLQQVNFTWALFTAPLSETLLVNFSLKSYSCSTLFFLPSCSSLPPCHPLQLFRVEILFESGLVIISATTKVSHTVPVLSRQNPEQKKKVKFHKDWMETVSNVAGQSLPIPA